MFSDVDAKAGKLVLIPVVIFLMGLGIKNLIDSKEVSSSQSIGKGLDVKTYQDWWAGDHSELVTEKGKFIVKGNFILLEGNPLVLETMKSGASRICDKSLEKCFEIKG